MKTEDIDKLKQSIDDGLVIAEDVDKALEDGKISFVEGSSLVLKHAVKAVRFVSNIKEIGQEIADLDGEEAAEVGRILTLHFGGSEEASEAIQNVLVGVGNLNQGIQKLIALKKADKGN